MARMGRDPAVTAGLLADATSTTLGNVDTTMYVYEAPTEEQRKREEFGGIRESGFVPRPGGMIFAGSDAKIKPMTLRDLEGYCPTQLQFLFPHPEKDRHDGWFLNLIFDLFVRVEAFSMKYFAREINFPANRNPDLWTEDLAPEFINYAADIARGDPLRGGWSQLLRSEKERSYLIMATISKILDANVFSELLFGAEEESGDIKEGLKWMDENMLNEEGR